MRSLPTSHRSRSPGQLKRVAKGPQSPSWRPVMDQVRKEDPHPCVILHQPLSPRGRRASLTMTGSAHRHRSGKAMARSPTKDRQNPTAYNSHSPARGPGLALGTTLGWHQMWPGPDSCWTPRALPPPPTYAMSAPNPARRHIERASCLTWQADRTCLHRGEFV